ncbi:hypothetical protein JKP88DRAFT_249302 [Tribonema minus]|uniref:Uncharacterized protein n=1 Tax=Tribonema minus TaxID=303371 RepID=A0A836C8R6_9STRA|nr:hypothetical protein JKP88DRAFT_249302 [Tribonema minus]
MEDRSGTADADAADADTAESLRTSAPAHGGNPSLASACEPQRKGAEIAGVRKRASNDCAAHKEDERGDPGAQLAADAPASESAGQKPQSALSEAGHDRKGDAAPVAKRARVEKALGQHNIGQQPQQQKHKQQQTSLRATVLEHFRNHPLGFSIMIADENEGSIRVAAGGAFGDPEAVRHVNAVARTAEGRILDAARMAYRTKDSGHEWLDSVNLLCEPPQYLEAPYASGMRSAASAGHWHPAVMPVPPPLYSTPGGYAPWNTYY